MRAVLIATRAAMLVAILEGCRGRPQISGEIRDNFGLPLAGAQVEVAGTAFAATTGRDGTYTIAYVPGAIKLEVSKDGYVPAGLELNVAVETRVPAKAITLYKKPPGQGLYFVGASDYVPLTRVRLVVRNQNLGFRGWDQPGAVSYYQLDGIADKTLAHLPCERAARASFVDSEPASVRLFQAPWDGYTVLAREYSTTMSRDTARRVKEDPSSRQPGFIVRTARLECGFLYAFVAKGAGAQFCDIGCGGMPFGAPLAEPAYAFEFR